MDNNNFYAQQTSRHERQSTPSNLQTSPLTSRNSSPSSPFNAPRTARYNNDVYDQVLEFKIQLRYIKKPTIWRRIQVPSDYTFFQFHLTIQCCMGWLVSIMFGDLI